MERRVFVGDVGVDHPAGLGPVFGFTCPVVSARPPARNRCPSDDDVVPSPQFAANGCPCCALTSSVRAAAYVSSRGRRDEVVIEIFELTFDPATDSHGAQLVFQFGQDAQFVEETIDAIAVEHEVLSAVFHERGRGVRRDLRRFSRFMRRSTLTPSITSCGGGCCLKFQRIERIDAQLGRYH